MCKLGWKILKLQLFKMENAGYLSEDDVPGEKLLKDPSDCRVVHLKRWVECHGEKKTWKKKTDKV